MLPTLGNQRASFIVLTSPAPEGILLFQASPYEIKMEMPAISSQIPIQLYQKKKGRGKEARNSREELINIKIFTDFHSPEIPLCH